MLISELCWRGVWTSALKTRHVLAEDGQEPCGTDPMQITPRNLHPCWPGRRRKKNPCFHILRHKFSFLQSGYPQHEQVCSSLSLASAMLLLLHPQADKFTAPDNPFFVCDESRSRASGHCQYHYFLLKWKAIHAFPLLRLPWHCCNVMSLLSPSKHRGLWSVPRQDRDTCRSLRHQHSLLWWLGHQVEENGSASRQAGWGPEAQF